MITVEKADEIIARDQQPLTEETIPFENAMGRILREPIKADRDLPPYDRIMMDGVVISSAGWATGHRSFSVSGLQLPGNPPLTLNNPNSCIKAMTGAVMPQGCDIVVPREEYEETAEMVTVNKDFIAEPERFLHRSGSDHLAGEVLINPGVQLGPNEIAVMASCGLEKVAVTREIRMTVIDTGDELVKVGDPITPYQIRRSNAHALTSASVKEPYVTATSHHCPDDRNMLKNLIGETLEVSDLVLLSGGVSKGERDYVPGVLAEYGVETCFHWVRQWPGKPLWFGRRSGGPLVFGLPGNPLSALTCFHRYVKTVLRGLAGVGPVKPFEVVLTEAITYPRSTTAFLPVNISTGKAGFLEAVPKWPRNSGDFVSIVGTDGFVQLPAEQNDFPIGFMARFFSW
ncbi:MAG: molybdopterin molybdotransferase MoeA [Opitutales bacterium]